MIGTPVTLKAREIAQRVFEGKTDITGYPYMHMREAVAEKMESEYTAAAALLLDVYDCSDITEKSLIGEGMPMSVVYVLYSITQRKDEPHQDYLKRLARDDDLLYPVALASAEYLGNIDNYKDITVNSIAECGYYSMKHRLLKKYHDGESVFPDN